jgi:hypothetical protein
MGGACCERDDEASASRERSHPVAAGKRTTAATKANVHRLDMLEMLDMLVMPIPVGLPPPASALRALIARSDSG